MKAEYYYEYCNGILGVKTDAKDFKWVYGSVAPQTQKEKYEQCKVKFEIRVKPEAKLGIVSNCDRCFQAYTWDESSQTLYYRRKLFLNFHIGFNIKITGNTVYAEIGEHYYKHIKNRTMNLHAMYYLLSDIANIILLKNGLLTLYASAVCDDNKNKGWVFFGAPATGKTLTAMKICENQNYSLLGEDILITDGNQIFSCPWTMSFRKKSSIIDDAGACGRKSMDGSVKYCDHCEITDMVVLSIGREKTENDKNELFSQASILNGYLFNYYSSPIVKILAFMNQEYQKDWEDMAKQYLKKIIANCKCLGIQAERPELFAQVILREEKD